MFSSKVFSVALLALRSHERETRNVKVMSRMLEIVTREIWGAADVLPCLQVSAINQAMNVIMLNTHTPLCSNLEECSRGLRRLQHLHIHHAEKSDIKYNFVVCGDGRLYEGRGWGIEPTAPHKFKRLRNSLVIAFEGNYRSRDLPRIMFETGSQLVLQGLHDGFISPKFKLHDLQIQFEEATF